jgi:hypothetical protein
VQYIEALAEYGGPGPSLFLAGGISGTFDWQADVVAGLADLPLVLLNPRRRNFPINDPTAAPTQIEWEFHHLRRATAVLFWFPSETLCPIALYELGGRALVLYSFGMATPTVSAGYRRRLGRNEPLGTVPNGSFLFWGTLPRRPRRCPPLMNFPLVGAWLPFTHTERRALTDLPLSAPLAVGYLK